MPYAKLHPLPKLQMMFKVIPYNRETNTFLWDEALPQPFDTLDMAKEAGRAMKDNNIIKNFVIMQVQQSIPYASFPFTIVEPKVN